MQLQTHTKPTVLVVDGDRSRAAEYASWLRDACRVGVAENAAGALSAIDEVDGAVDVVLVGDHADGFADEVVVTVRDRGLDSRVVLLTETEPDDPFERGYDDYLVGEVTRRTLTAVVERVADAEPYERLRVTLSQLRIRRNVLHLELSREGRVVNDRYNRTVERIDELERRDATYRAGVERGPQSVVTGD